MATLALSMAGSAVGGAVLPSLSVFGASISGAAIGQAVGAIAGQFIDQSLFQSSGQSQPIEGPRLSDLHVMTSREGAPIPRLYGRARLSGEVIWATRLEEEVVRSGGGSSGGKASGRSSAPASPSTVDYRYYGNFAVGIAEGPITRIGRVWADGQEIDISHFTYRLHRGTETQQPDSFIKSKRPSGSTPAFRGVAYVVFERMPLAEFGNRLPQLSFEVFRAVDGLEEKIKAVTLIPGAGEFIYDPEIVSRTEAGGLYVTENKHSFQGGTDWRVSLRELLDNAPNLEHVSLIVSWFGTDLRAGHCQVKPGVEIAEKETQPYSWSVSSTSRSAAHLVSTEDGRPAYGGTPSDEAVVRAIQDLKSRGLKVTIYPFILMDVPGGNGLPDPYGASEQGAYPWRGRITVSPAPGQPGSPDKTSAVASDVASFVGTAGVGHFAIAGTNVTYTGPMEWSFRRMILHYAHLAVAAGGVDTFLIGSEMRGLTTVRSGVGTYPFVQELQQLAGDVRSVVGSGTKISYAADWSEVRGHQPDDGSGDVYFHLDPLWSSSDIDAIGIDFYLPLSDWRHQPGHLDSELAASVYDKDYLRGGLNSGEYFDWYYASDADRTAQVRTPITDGAGKPWVFRTKDLWSWWSQPHFNRPGGVESATATAWVPQSKPIWLTEVGCPAIDLGANQPNVFVDPKSSESTAPHFSRGTRDDFMQRRYLDVVLSALDPNDDDFIPSLNPVSGITGKRMFDPERLYVYTWDARPYPVFPYALDLWADGANWTYGHWVNGRLGSAGLAAVVRKILEDFGFPYGDAGALEGTVDGYVIDRIMSARAALQPLELAYFFDSVESAGSIRFAPRGSAQSGASLDLHDLVETNPDGDLAVLTRGQETELPASVKLGFINGASDYQHASAESRRLTGGSERVSTAELPIVFNQGRADATADAWLHDTWNARDRARFHMPPTAMGLEAGDTVTLVREGRAHQLRLTSVGMGEALDVEARSIDTSVFRVGEGEERVPLVLPALNFGPTDLVFLDLPMLPGVGQADAHAGYLAAAQSPWPGRVSVLRSSDDTGFVANTTLSAPAIMGATLSDLAPGPVSRFAHGHTIDVEISGGTLASVPDLSLFSGQNIAATAHPDGAWELIQFGTAELIATNTYRLDRLLRGQFATEHLATQLITAGARFVVIDEAVLQAAMSLDDVGLAFNWRYGPTQLDLDDPSWQTTEAAFHGAGLRPLSPVHVRSHRNGDDVEITWIRRSRVGGDSWESADVPLGEDLELYRLQVFDGNDVVRTWDVNSIEATYTSAMQLADFGTVQPNYQISIAQVGSFIGSGQPAIATVG